ADRRVAHRAEQRRLVDGAREPGQEFGEADAGQDRVDGREGAADALGRLVLGVPEIEVAGAALKVDHDHALSAAETGAVARGGGGTGLGLVLEEVGEAEAEQGGAADAKELAAGHAVTRGSALLTGNHEHVQSLRGGRRSRRVRKRSSWRKAGIL